MRKKQIRIKMIDDAICARNRFAKKVEVGAASPYLIKILYGADMDQIVSSLLM